MYLNTIEESISIKDLMMPMCNKKKAFVYELDWTKDFIKDVLRHEDKLKCQNMYFQHYSKIEPCLLLEPDDLQSEQKIGHCCIHPTADIHPTAVVRILIMLTLAFRLDPMSRLELMPRSKKAAESSALSF